MNTYAIQIENLCEQENGEKFHNVENISSALDAEHPTKLPITRIHSNSFNLSPFAYPNFYI